MTTRLLPRVLWTAVTAAVLAIGAISRYPGGTTLDRASRGYSLSQNFLSDLGMTVAYNKQPNRFGAGLFVASLFVLVVGLGSAVVGIARRLAEQRAARRWARSAAVAGLLACVAFAGVAVTPENRVMAVHIAFTRWAWRVVPVVAALLAWAAVQTPGLRIRVAMTWLVVATALATYAALLVWGPSLATRDGLVFQVVAQKTATAVLIAALLFVAREFDRLPAHSNR